MIPMSKLSIVRKSIISIFSGVFLLLLTSTYSLAQTPACACFIKGVVRDQHTGLPVIGATVLMVGQNKAVFTDEQGRYMLDHICPGSYEIECRIVGYNPFREKIDLTSGHEEDFTLEESEIHLKDVEITAHRTDAPASQPLTTLSGTELFKTRGD
jgi:iron complex outermembrane receptor protein